MDSKFARAARGLSMAILLLAASGFQALFSAEETSIPGPSPASRHIVSAAEAKAAVAARSAERGARLETIARLLDTEMARAQLARWGLETGKVKTAVGRLSDRELAGLAARAEEVMADMQGGMSRTTRLFLIMWGVIIGSFLLVMIVT